MKIKSEFFFLRIFLLSFLLFSAVSIFGCSRFAGMVSVDTRNDRERSYNSAPAGYEYIEIFLCKDENETFWGALSGGNKKGYLLSKYDLNSGKCLKQIRLPNLNKTLDHEIACFPESDTLIYCNSYYNEKGKTYRNHEIIQYDIASGKSKIIRESPAGSIINVCRISSDCVLITETAAGINGKTIFTFYNIHRGEERTALLPYREICEVLSVSQDGKKLLVSTFHRLFLYDITHLKVLDILVDSDQNAISFEGDFSPDGNRVVFSMMRNRKPELYIRNLSASQNSLELLRDSKAEFDFFSPRFLDDSTIVYRDSGNLNFIFPSTLISFFNLQQKKILKTVKTPGIMSPLFVIGPHLVFVR